MKKSPVSKILAALIAVFALVAIFVMFSDCFAGPNGERTGLGSCYDVMFATGLSNQLAPVPLFIAGFGVMLFAFLLSFAGFALPSRAYKLFYAIETILFVGVAVLFLFSMRIWEMTEGSSLAVLHETTLGAGSICVIVFSFLAAAVSLIGFLFTKKDA